MMLLGAAVVLFALSVSAQMSARARRWLGGVYGDSFSSLLEEDN